MILSYLYVYIHTRAPSPPNGIKSCSARALWAYFFRDLDPCCCKKSVYVRNACKIVGFLTNSGIGWQPSL
jgi:hypothetical protein